MGNLSIYDKARKVPPEALKPIQAGRLKGKSDINPMWRIKELTEQFGPCGIGWKYAITRQWLEDGGNEEKAAFVNIELCIKVDGEWSDPIPGTGGSSFVAKESKGLYTSDECFKMALTDAISVSCKALGFGADVYWDKDSTKYNKQPPASQPNNQTAARPPQQQQPPRRTDPPSPPQQTKVLPVNWPSFWATIKDLGFTQQQVHEHAKVESIAHYTREQANALFVEMSGLKKHMGVGA